MDIQTTFEKIGAEFFTSIDTLEGKLSRIKAFVFDWDGVFNDGRKGEGVNSSFSEADSMGVNLIRFSYWLQQGEMPTTAIITGQRNPSAVYMAKREHFHAVYLGYLDKSIAFKEFLEQNDLAASQVAYFFDDVLDASIAKQSGLRILLRRDANPVFQEFLREHDYADYVTGRRGDNFGVREACELLLALRGNQNDTFSGRIDFNEAYHNYFNARQEIDTLERMNPDRATRSTQL